MKYKFDCFDATIGAFAGGLLGYAVSLLAGVEPLGNCLFTAAFMLALTLFYGIQRDRKEEKSNGTKRST